MVINPSYVDGVNSFIIIEKAHIVSCDATIGSPVNEQHWFWFGNMRVLNACHHGVDVSGFVLALGCDASEDFVHYG